MEDSEDRKRKIPKAYVHSGNYPASAIFLVPIISALPFLILAPIYVAGILYIPVIILNLFLIGIYGIVSGLIVQEVGKNFKVRHSQLQHGFAALVGIFAICLSWFFWVKIISGVFIFSPFAMLRMMAIIAEKGTWGIMASPVSGILLYIFWLIEAGCIIIISVICSKIDGIFCEKCDKWVETSDTFSPLAVCENIPALVKSVMSGNFEKLKSLGRQDKSSGHYTSVVLTYCLICNQLHILSIFDFVETPAEDGKGVDLERKTILENILIDYEDYKLLKNNWK